MKTIMKNIAVYNAPKNQDNQFTKLITTQTVTSSHIFNEIKI